MAFRVVWSRTSQRDLWSLVRYIARDSPARAESFGYRIVSQVELLQDHPLIGRIVPELHQADFREIIVVPYRIVYHIKQDMEILEIVRVWHAARGIPEI